MAGKLVEAKRPVGDPQSGRHPAEVSEEAARAFLALHEVLRGGRRPSAEWLSKMWFIVLGGAFEKPVRFYDEAPAAVGTEQARADDRFTLRIDAESTSTAFVLHFPPQRRRRPHRYTPALAPAMVGHLMTQAGLNAIMQPIVVGLPAVRVAAARSSNAPPGVGFPAWRRGPRLVWIVPNIDVVKLFVRNGPDERHPWWRKAASDGPLAIPAPLPAWESKVLFSSEPACCPHCGVTGSRQRQLEGGVLVCSRCSRSFERDR